MSTTLISHFWNEEFLLPYWLRHHVPMFDRAVLIDYCSTDRSVDIVKTLAPEWEVRPSRNAWFDARDADTEVMAIEQEFPGWKIVLNTTEFLLCLSLAGLIDSLRESEPPVFGIWPFDLTMVDCPAERDREITNDQLFVQKHWGYHSRGSRSRLFHRLPNGGYAPGRHSSEAVPKSLDDRIFILWFGWCPIRYVRDRKLRIQERISPRDRADGLGWHHFISPDQLESNYQNEAAKAYDLWENHPSLRSVIQSLGDSRKDPVGIKVPAL